MIRATLSLFVALPLLFSAPLTSLAQQADLVSTNNFVQDSPLRCSDFYLLGAMLAETTFLAETAVAGLPASFETSLTNTNAAPLVDVSVVAKVFMLDEGGQIVTTLEYLTIASEATFASGETKTFNYVWDVPQAIPSGSYQVSVYVVSGGQYNWLGLPFTGDVLGSSVPFTVVSDTSAPLAPLRSSDITVNGITYRPETSALPIPAGESVTVSTLVENPSDEPVTLGLIWQQFAWSAEIDDALRHTTSEIIELGPLEAKRITFATIPQEEAVMYVSATIESAVHSSNLGIRLVQTGVDQLRTGYLGVSQFPLTAGEPVTAVACAQNINPATLDMAQVSLTLKDRNDVIIHTVDYFGPVAGDLRGYGEVFVPDQNYNYLKIESVVARQGEVDETMTVIYDCTAIDPDACLEDSEENIVTGVNQPPHPILYVGGVIILLLLVIVFVYFLRRRGVSSNTKVPPPSNPSVTLGLFFGLMVLTALPSYAAAQSCPLLQPGYESPADASDIILYQGALMPNCQALCNAQMASENGTRYCNLSSQNSGMQWGFVVPDVGLSDGSWTYTCRLSQQPQTYANPFILPTRSWAGSTCTAPVVTNSPPATPTITGPASGQTGTSYSFAIQATDPDNNTVRYGIDVNNDNLIDAWLPSSGYANSGTQLAYSRSWPTAGTHTIRAIAEDSNGARSGWSSHTITITAPVSPPGSPGSCQVGAEQVLADFDGWVGDPLSHQVCIGVNYIAPSYGGTGLIRQLAPCPNGLTAGGTSPNGSCFSRIEFDRPIDPSRCVAYGFYCSGTTPPAPVTQSSLTGSGCTIPAGASTCNGSVTWNVLDWNTNGFYTITRTVTNQTNSSGFIAGLISGTRSIMLTEGENKIVLWETVSPPTFTTEMNNQYAEVTLAGTCADGTSWNGSACTVAIGSCTLGAEQVGDSGPTDMFAGSPTCLNVDDLAPYTSPNCPLGATTGTVVSTTDIINVGFCATRQTQSSACFGTAYIRACVGTTVPSPSNNCQSNQVVNAVGTACGVNGDYVPSLNACTEGCGEGCGVYDSLDALVCYLPFNPTNTPPAPPQIQGPVTGEPNTVYQFTLTATDADNDQIRYGVDWDNNGTVDVWLPGSGYVNSGVSQNISRSWPTDGATSFRVLAQDAAGAVSSWVSHPIIISTAGATLSGTTCEIVEGASACNGTATWDLSSASNPVIRNDTHNIIYGTGINGSGNPISLRYGDNYVVAYDDTMLIDLIILTTTCASGSVWDGSVCGVAPPPVPPTPNLSIVIGPVNVSPESNPITGTYDSVQVTFLIRNEAPGSAVTDNIPYRLRMFRVNDDNSTGEQLGATRTDQINGGLAVGDSRSIPLAFDDVPFGNLRFIAEVNPEPQTITESTYADNIAQTDPPLLPPPPPDLDLRVSPSNIVRNETSVTLNWSVSASYSMNCTVTGPGLETVTFDPEDSTTGSAVTNPLTSQSNYTLSCTEPTTNTTFPPFVIVVEVVGSPIET